MSMPCGQGIVTSSSEGVPLNSRQDDPNASNAAGGGDPPRKLTLADLNLKPQRKVIYTFFGTVNIKLFNIVLSNLM